MQDILGERLIGGLRAEQTNINAEGPLNDPTLNYRRDANGDVINGPNGRPLPIVPATDPLGVGTHAVEANRP